MRLHALLEHGAVVAARTHDAELDEHGARHGLVQAVPGTHTCNITQVLDVGQYRCMHTCVAACTYVGAQQSSRVHMREGQWGGETL